MIATTIAVAISLFLGLVAVAALISVAQSVRRGLASGKAILRELAMLEAGMRPAPPVRTAPARKARAATAPRRAVTLRPAALRYAAA